MRVWRRLRRANHHHQERRLTKEPLHISVHALLFRAAQVFEGDADKGQRRLRVEPLRTGGVAIVACAGSDLVVVPDPSGTANRAATIASPGALSKLAVDIFRRDSVATRLNVAGGMAWIEPDVTHGAARNIELDQPFEDWRAMLAPHMHARLKPPIAGDARMSRRLADVAANLARAAGRPEQDQWRLCGGHENAILATFPAWPGAVAFFADNPGRASARADHRGDWTPPHWLNAPRLALVEASR
jgi:hypothetical protein